MVIIPTFLENSEGFSSRFREIINKLRTDFGYIPTQHTVIDNVRGIAEEIDIDTVNEKEKNRPHTDSGIDEFDHEFEKISEIEEIIFYQEAEEERAIVRTEIDALIDGI